MQFCIPGCKEDPPLRAVGKMVHLTYAVLYDGELTFERMLAAARTWAATRQGLREYTIGRETHPQPADPQRPKHFHAYFKFWRLAGGRQPPAEKRVRREAGRSGPRGPGVEGEDDG